MEKILKRYYYDAGDKVFKQARGAKAGSVVPESKIAAELLEAGASMANIEKEVELFKQQCGKSTEVQVDTWASIKTILENINPFENFYRMKNLTSKTTMVYYQKDLICFPVCDITKFDENAIHGVFMSHDQALGWVLLDSTKKYINFKAWGKVSMQDAIKVAVNILQPTKTMREVVSTQEPHPVVVDGCLVPALSYIPYTQQKVTLSDLNPELQEFLGRVSNHEYMCANLWTNFIGIKTAAMLYLKGAGQDGKSSFVKMLGKLTGSVCNYDWSERFNYFNMFGKSLIVLNENKMPNILQHSVLKSITGGDCVQIEGKGQNAFSGEVRGQLIVVANDPIIVIGTPDEARRLRYHKVKALNLTEAQLLSPDEYTQRLAVNPNAFLNYMRVCYEKLKTDTGMVSTPPDHKETLKALRDPKMSKDFKKAWESVMAEYEVFPGGRVLVEEVLNLLYRDKEFEKQKYALSNFEALAVVDYNIIKDEQYYLNLRKKGSMPEGPIPKETT